MRKKHKEFVSRCRGTILGTAFGDALGLPVEGMTAEQIKQQHGEITDFLQCPEGVGRYSDDTQLTLATGISLIRREGVDSEDCARSCAELFDSKRGYGRSATRVLTALNNGADYLTTGRLLFPSGSFGNGAAMRISPVGLMYGHLPLKQLRPLVFDAVCATHVHDEAIDGALLVASLVGRLSRLPRAEAFELNLLFDEFNAICRNQLMREKVSLVAALLKDKVDVSVAAQLIGCGVRSSESVALALYLACRFIDVAETAVIQAVQCGGDADTIAAMVGALVGARHGDQVFPLRWHRELERGEGGYEGLIEMSETLAATAVNKGFFVDFCV